MTTPAKFRSIILKLPTVIEKPHFDRASFRVNVPKGKIFCTLAGDRKTANLLLGPDQQFMLCSNRPEMFYRVKNKWGEQGWTVMTLKKTDEITLKSALRLAWTNGAPAIFHDLLV